jgi:hypothetical protein
MVNSIQPPEFPLFLESIVPLGYDIVAQNVTAYESL